MCVRRRALIEPRIGVAVTTGAMQMTLQKMTALPIGKFPIPACPRSL